MIGKIMIGKSFRGCLLYCLQDKIKQQENDEQIMKGRAEVLYYNQCFGNARELIKEFNDVRNLNPKLSKPVLHITLSLAPGEKLPANKLTEISQECARGLGFEKNQFVAILHKDTGHQHIHIVANRIGFDGKTLSDSNNYKKIANHCRSMEIKYRLKQVLNPRKYLNQIERKIPRLDQRKQRLNADIKRCLKDSKDYRQFEQKMKALKYEVIKGRGIAFRDSQKVYTKGSEVGFSLSQIEKILAIKPELRIQNVQIEVSEKNSPNTSQLSHTNSAIEKPAKTESQTLVDIIMKPEKALYPMNYELLKENKKRRRKKKGQSI
ncbi:MAG: relaxase/mobilization nuclease domain-containing protein [Bacteroidota bacterium]